jgi:hypothetical protein
VKVRQKQWVGRSIEVVATKEDEEMETAVTRLSLVDALKLLPGLKPLNVRNRLGEAKYWAGRAPNRMAQYEDAWLELDELEQLFIMDEQGRPCVSPAGAALLLDLYKRGVFELVDARKDSGDLDLLARYARGEPVVLDKPARSHAPRRPKPPADPKPAARPPERPAEPSPINYAALTVHRLG